MKEYTITLIFYDERSITLNDSYESHLDALAAAVTRYRVILHDVKWFVINGAKCDTWRAPIDVLIKLRENMLFNVAKLLQDALVYRLLLAEYL